MEKNQQFVSTLSVKAYRLCQLPRAGSQRIVLIQQPLKARPQLAPPSGELAKPIGFD